MSLFEFVITLAARFCCLVMCELFPSCHICRTVCEMRQKSDLYIFLVYLLPQRIWLFLKELCPSRFFWTVHRNHSTLIGRQV